MSSLRWVPLLSCALAGCSGEGPLGRRRDPDPTTADGALDRSSSLETSDRDGYLSVLLDVPAGVTAFQVTGTAPGHELVYLEEVYDPRGDLVLYWEDWWDSPYSLTDAIFGFDDTTAFDWPVRAEDGPLRAGTWELVWSLVDRDGYYAPRTEVRVSTALKRDDDPEAARVAVQIVYADGVDDDPDVVAAVEQAVERWREVWGAVGLELAETYRGSTLDPSLPFARKGGEPDVARVAETREDGALQLVIGEQIGDSTSLYGIAAGIPGTIESTDLTFVSISWLTCAGPNGRFDADEIRLMGETMAHEVGHYQGLFHPVEGGYDAWDALGDTPECGRYVQCVDVLGTNVMYPYSVCDRDGCLPTDQYTPEQVGVMQQYIASL